MAATIDRELLEQALDEIRPALQGDGGDVTVREVDDDGVVTVELLGACGTCPLQIVTLAAGIELYVQRRVPGVSGVIAHSATLPDTGGFPGLDVTSV
jgi:Fe-S cluster biogenesis protein NfuA